MTNPIARTMRYTVVFSKYVVGVDAADFAVVKSSGVAASIARVSGSGTTYTVDLVAHSGVGMVSLGLAARPTITDSVSQAFVAPSPFVTSGCTVIATGLACANAVTTTADGGVGSLRQRIAELPAGSTIVFAPALSGQTITLTSALVLTKSVTIDASLSNAQIIIDGGGTSGLFSVTPGQKVNLIGLHMAHASGGQGGALWNAGTLVIRNSSITGSRSTISGAALFNKGTATLVNTTIYQNTATTGAVIANEKDANLMLLHTTVSGNTAQSIVVQNIGHMTLKNSIIADSVAMNCFSSSFYGTLVVANSIVEDRTCSASKGGDPRLAAAALNGAYTYTKALNAGSIAINAANDSVCISALVGSRDQRGAMRPAGAHCDIGAYEANGVIPTATVARLPTATRTITRTRTRTATPRLPVRTITRTPTRRVP